MKLLYIGIIVLIVLLVISYRVCRKKIENFDQLIESVLPTVVGGSTASKVVYNDSGDSTNVLKLTGDSDQTIIFIHNTPMNLQIWYPVFMEAQKAKNRGEKIPTMYAYDIIGHGTAWLSVPESYMDTDIDNHIWGYDDYVDQFHTIYEKFVEGKVTVVGYGTGGLIAQAIGIKYPNIIEKIVVLGSTIGPTETGFTDEIGYLVGWYNQNKNIDYLTMETSFVNHNMCMWFENNNILKCSHPKNREDTTDETTTAQYLIADKIYRQASCTTYVQLDKLAESEDIRKAWDKNTVQFPIQFVIGDRDHYTNLEEMKKDLETVRKTDNLAEMVVIKGKHGFPVSHPDLIYKLALGEDIKTEPLVLQVQ